MFAEDASYAGDVPFSELWPSPVATAGFHQVQLPASLVTHTHIVVLILPCYQLLMGTPVVQLFDTLAKQLQPPVMLRAYHHLFDCQQLY